MKGKASQRRNSSTIRPRSSIAFVITSADGGRFLILTTGTLRQKQLACCSTGATTISATSARSSAKSRRWKQSFG